jgi:hypothetical protein
VYTRYTNVSRLIAGSNKTSRGWDGGGRGPCSRPGTERMYEENTACVPDAQAFECLMDPVECVGC